MRPFVSGGGVDRSQGGFRIHHVFADSLKKENRTEEQSSIPANVDSVGAHEIPDCIFVEVADQQVLESTRHRGPAHEGPHAFPTIAACHAGSTNTWKVNHGPKTSDRGTDQLSQVSM